MLEYRIYIFIRMILSYFEFQLVWANSYSVGCGSTRCAELEGAEDGENSLFFVCYYGPG